jgi:ATP-binding protein involved in chromosome partitioning
VVTRAATTPVSAEAVVKALEAVDDPHVPVSLRRMGMISGVDVGADGAVQVRLRIPCLGCPGMGMIGDGVREVVGAMPGVSSVEVIEAWEDAWRRDMVDESARGLMHDNGIQI